MNGNQEYTLYHGLVTKGGLFTDVSKHDKYFVALYYKEPLKVT